MRSFDPRIVLLALFGALAAPEALAAPPGADGFRPAASVESHISTESSQVLPKWTPSASLLTLYGQELGSRDPAQNWSIDRRVSSHLLLALGLFDWVQLDLDLPMVLYQQGFAAEQPGATIHSSSLGDLRTSLKGTLLRSPDRGFGLGLSFDLTLPTGKREALAGSGALGYAPQLLVEQHMAYGIVLAANLGYAIRKDYRVDDFVHGDAFTYRGAARLPLGKYEQFSTIFEFDGSVGTVDGAGTPLSLRGGFRWSTRSGVVLGTYVGGAPVRSLGVPELQGILSVGYAPPHRIRRERAFLGAPRPSAMAYARRYERIARLETPVEKSGPTNPDDPDGDGILTLNDRCPSVAEDRDRFEDVDGCPEWDNDRDGLRDALDLCPNAPELVNGYADWDGCPDRRLADGKGVSSTRFDPRSILPDLDFEENSDTLQAQSIDALQRLAELLRLNPWMGQLEVTVALGVSEERPFDHELADRRTAVISNFLLDQGIENWRLRIEAPGTSRNEDWVRLALQSTSGGLSPLAPAPETFDRLLAEAEAAGKALVESQPGPGTEGEPQPGISVMAQGPEEQTLPPTEAVAEATEPEAETTEPVAEATEPEATELPTLSPESEDAEEPHTEAPHAEETQPNGPPGLIPSAPPTEHDEHDAEHK